ncbi:MAG: hypothetical protein KY459_03145 [Acidobacteria bacterium]|nr:hypothetical protein [Acidobacteriota bacterium]
MIDHLLPGIALALGMTFIAAAAFFPVIRLGRYARLGVLILLAIPILLSPLAIPASETLARALVAMIAVFVFFKMFDVHVGAGYGGVPDLRTYLRWLPNLLTLVLRKLHLEPRPTQRENGLRLLRVSIVIAAALAAVAGLRMVEWTDYPFALEHALKALVIFVGYTASFGFIIHTLRLAGVQSRDFTMSLWRARTPADFWNRYNRNISQFLFEDVFRPVRRFGSRTTAVLAAFAVSGIAHEYIFSIAIGRVEGYQTAFFLLQGLAVAATAGWKPAGWQVVPAALGTLLFLLVSSVLFFASFHAVVPIYMDGPPHWLPGQ